MSLLTVARLVALLIGTSTLAWQAYQATRGNIPHRFFVAELTLGLFLVGAFFVRSEVASPIILIIGFSFTAGVFAVALGALTIGEIKIGPMIATAYLAMCVVLIYLLSQTLRSG